MRSIYRISGIIILSACILSCRRTDPMEAVFAPEEIVLDAAPSAETKGFLNTGSLTVDGTQFQMFDYLSGYTGTLTDGGGAQHSDGEEFQYFENTLTYKSGATPWQWLFGDVASPSHYRWTRTGTHHFYGWMLKDATAGTAPDSPSNRVSSSFFTTYTPGTKMLTVGKSLTVDSPQYDFLYSDVVPVDVIADGIPQKVDMPMKHLFGAFGITISNNSTLDIIVYSVRLKNFPGNGTATLDYDMINGVALSQPDPTSAGTYTYWDNKISSSFTLYNRNHAQGGKVYDCLTGTEIPSGGQPQFRLCWPMSFNALEPTKVEDDEDGNPVYSASSPLIEVRYAEAGKADGTITFRFPKLEGATQAITAGKKTQLNLNFADKQIILSYDILPWLYKDFPMAFEEDAISATQLKFVENTFVSMPKVTDDSGKHDVIQLTASSTEGPYTAKGTFKVYTPVNAQLLVTLSGNGEDFVVTLDSGNSTGGTQSITIDPHRDGALITLRIKPKGTPKSGSKCYLHFGILNNGRDSDADTEINRDNYMIVIP